MAVCFLISLRREQNAMRDALVLSVTGNLAHIVDANCVKNVPVRRTDHKFVQVEHLLILSEKPENGAIFGVRLADHLAAGIDCPRPAFSRL